MDSSDGSGPDGGQLVQNAMSQATARHIDLVAL